MKEIRSVGPDLDVCLTDTNRLAIMVESEYGEHLAEVTDLDALISKLRELALIQAELSNREHRSMVSTAEVELERAIEARATEPCPYRQAHTRDFCGRPTCRES